MDVSTGIETLQLFNEKADKLESLSFTKELYNSGTTISYNQGQSLQVERYGPDDESIDAFVLTIRFFVQKNETISIQNIEGLYSGLPICASLTAKLIDARTKTNAALDQITPISLNGVDLSSKYIFDIFLYGGLAHANKKKRIVFDSWKQNSMLFPLLESEFIRAIGIHLNMIFFARAINEEALNQLIQQP